MKDELSKMSPEEMLQELEAMKRMKSDKANAREKKSETTKSSSTPTPATGTETLPNIPEKKKQQL